MNEDISYIGIRKTHILQNNFTLKPSEELFGITQSDRSNHLYTIGQTGSGKTTLLRNLVYQDIMMGRGVIVIDPHGDLIQDILAHIPVQRTTDVVLIDPSDEDDAIGLNFFDRLPKSIVKRTLALDNITSVFRHVWELDDKTTPQLLLVLQNTIAALSEAPNTTLLSIYHFLMDDKYRSKILKHVTDQEIRKFWINGFNKYEPRRKKDSTSSTINKAFKLNASPILRTIVGQTRTRIDFGTAMDKQQIVLCDLSKGRMGEGDSSLLGAMILIQTYMAALARADRPENERIPAHLYIDEFQNFGANSVFRDMLSESRKYGIRLTLSHQDMSQLELPMKNTLLGNVGSIVSFRVGSEDAERLAKEFANSDTEYEFHQFTELANHTVLALLQDEGARTVIEGNTMPSIGKRTNQADAVRRFCRHHYAQPRERIQRSIDREFRFNDIDKIQDEIAALAKAKRIGSTINKQPHGKA